MDASFYWFSGIAVSAALGFIIWLVKDNNKRTTEKLQSELEALGASKEQLEKINEAQATPFTTASHASEWVRKQRNGHR